MEVGIILIKLWLQFLDKPKGFGLIYQGVSGSIPDVKYIGGKNHEYIADMNLDIDLSTINQRYRNTQSYWNEFIQYLQICQNNIVEEYNQLDRKCAGIRYKISEDETLYASYEKRMSVATTFPEQQICMKGMSDIKMRIFSNNEAIKDIETKGQSLRTSYWGYAKVIELAKKRKWISGYWNKQPNNRKFIMRIR